MSAGFTRQVERLARAGLLPPADKDALAGYLRRAGQDILAIGRYREDEKNGILLPLFLLLCTFPSRFPILFLVSHFSIHSNLD